MTLSLEAQYWFHGFVIGVLFTVAIHEFGFFMRNRRKQKCLTESITKLESEMYS